MLLERFGNGTADEREDGKNEPQINADFGLGFDYAPDQCNIPSDNVSDFAVIIGSET